MDINGLTSLYNYEWIDISYRVEDKLLYAVWKLPSELMTEEDFKHINNTYVNIAKEKGVEIFLINTCDMQFAIRPELQEWVGLNIVVPMASMGLRKLAIIVSSELIVQLSVEQTLEESDAPFQIAYFEHEEEALQWLGR
jgi:hypothetical protein